MPQVTVTFELDELSLSRILIDIAKRTRKPESLPEEMNSTYELKAKVAADEPSAPVQIFGEEAPVADLPPAPEQIFSEEIAAAIPPNEVGLPPTLLQVVAPVKELDTRGFPWDARIHSSARSKIKSGEWKYLRGVSEGTIKLIELELSGKALILPPPAVSTLPPPPAPTAANPVVKTFKDYIQFTATSGVKHAQILEVLKKYSVPSTAILATRPEIITDVMRDLGAVI